MQALIDACLEEDGKLYLCVSSPTIKDKPVGNRQPAVAFLEHMCHCNGNAGNWDPFTQGDLAVQWSWTVIDGTLITNYSVFRCIPLGPHVNTCALVFHFTALLS